MKDVESCCHGSLGNLPAYHKNADCKAAMRAVDECIAAHQALAERDEALALAAAQQEEGQ